MSLLELLRDTLTCISTQDKAYKGRIPSRFDGSCILLKYPKKSDLLGVGRDPALREGQDERLRANIMHYCIPTAGTSELPPATERLILYKEN